MASTRIQHLNRDGSDHCPLLISCSKNQDKVPSSFRFLHAWVLHHGFKKSVEQNWNLPIHGSGLQAFWAKQRRLKQSLKRWNKEVFGDIFHNLKVAEQRAVDCELIFQQEQSIGNRAAMNKAYAQLNHYLSAEELFWKQKSGIKWLVEGEHNTKFFHMRVKKKRIKSHIFKIQNSDGSWIEEPDAVKSSAVEFFSSLMKKEPCNMSRFDAPLIPAIISDSDNLSLCADPTREELKEAVFNIDKDSVAGPDGFSSYFYQQCWDTVANDLLDAVIDFFHGAELPRGITSTTIVLLPKNHNASKWSDFRPISLCNVLNKIITKILANRLAKVLPAIITDNQSGFVGGRLISDNILLAHELIGKIDRKSRGENIALKLDMMKAYDRLEWDFLFRMLEQLGFNSQWIFMIRRCISNCWFSLLINGGAVGYFKSERGLRQGDSISPLLFILATEYLSRGLNALFAQYPSLHYASDCSMSVSHLAFADDILIFTNGAKSSLQKILKFLQEYEEISGQRINHSKNCFITHRNVANSGKQIISQVTGFIHKCLPITYLGVPLYKGPKKVILFDELVEKIRERIEGWDNKILSPSGCITLLRSVLSSLPIYLLQVLKPPICVIEKIDRMFNNFLSGGSAGTRHIHWSAWHKITLPSSEGGLDIRGLGDVFEAFSMKLWWRFMSSNSILTLFMRTKYCTAQISRYFQPKVQDSQTWKRMLASCTTAENYIRWRIGKGELFFWHDCWMGDTPLVNRFPLFASSMTKVSHFYDDGSWNVEKLNNVLPEDVVVEILNIPINPPNDDRAYWVPTSDGQFTTKSIWEIVRKRQLVNPMFDLIWHKSVPLTISFFLWRLLQNWIPVEIRLKTKGFQLASKCQHCNSEESLLHVMWKCPIAIQVWTYFKKFFQINIIHPQNVSQIIWAWLYSGDYTKKGHIRKLMPLLIFWFLWVERNDAKHRNLGMYPNRVVWRVLKLIHQLFHGRQFQRWQWRGDLQIAQTWGLIFQQAVPPPPRIFSWHKPSSGEFKLNVDGSAKHNFHNAAGGGLLRDHTGTLIFGFSENFGSCDSLQAELMALHRGLLLCTAYSVSRLWIEMDAKVVVHMINEGHQGSSRTRYLLASIRRSLSSISFRISHIHREGNQAADHLENQGHTHQNLKVFSQAENQLRGKYREVESPLTPSVFEISSSSEEASSVHMKNSLPSSCCANFIRWPSRPAWAAWDGMELVPSLISLVLATGFLAEAFLTNLCSLSGKT
ncbi:Reverse transcriptase domain - like 10 [Theobroma cacao]|nr:Reverse transcriptase domain - like 10 [Theobroma cacao]